MARRKTKPARARKPAKKPKPKVRGKKARRTKGPSKAAGEKKKEKKRGEGAGKEKAAATRHAASRSGGASVLTRSHTSTPTRHRGSPDAASESTAAPDRGIAASDSVRLITNADRGEGQPYPTQASDSAPPTHAMEMAAGIAEQEDRLEAVAPLLADADTVELLQRLLWWVGNPRKPRAAIVGRALHDLQSFTEELAYRRGSAAAVSHRINDKNPDHLREPIRRAMTSGKKSAEIGAALIGHLNKAWAVLEKIGLLRAAPSAGVYLIGRGVKVFDGFPDWETPEEEFPTKLTRPPRRPRS